MCWLRVGLALLFVRIYHWMHRYEKLIDLFRADSLLQEHVVDHQVRGSSSRSVGGCCRS